MSPNVTITLSVSSLLLAKMNAFYNSFRVANPNEYVLWQAKVEDTLITAYKMKKEVSKVVFQGKQAEYEASLWKEGALGVATPSVQAPENGLYKNLYPQIGSDEVGTGDYFGPICVAAGYVTRESLPRLMELGVTDSKKMSDAHILEIGPILLKEFPYAQLCLDNPTYNKLRRQGLNMNEVKAKMHNAALLKLTRKFPEAHVYMDQFAESSLYYHYLQNEKEVVSGITFKTKGETAFPSVALGSVLARYSFLKHMDALEKKIGEKIPLGAGASVDEFASRYYRQHGIEALDAISKANFGNRKKVLGEE